jgi:hypothetical protein
MAAATTAFLVISLTQSPSPDEDKKGWGIAMAWDVVSVANSMSKLARMLSKSRAIHVNLQN